MESSLSLFHGTGRDAAEAIVDHGFIPVDASAILEDLAVEFDLSAQAIRDHWATWFTENREARRDELAYFAGTPGLAGNYARRGPEVRHHGLQAVWHLLHNASDETGRDREKRIEADTWARQQLAGWDPVVVEVAFPVAVLPPKRVDTYINGPDIVGTPRQDLAFRNFGFPCAQIELDWIVGYTPVPPLPGG